MATGLGAATPAELFAFRGSKLFPGSVTNIDHQLPVVPLHSTIQHWLPGLSSPSEETPKKVF